MPSADSPVPSPSTAPEPVPSPAASTVPPVKKPDKPAVKQENKTNDQTKTKTGGSKTQKKDSSKNASQARSGGSLTELRRKYADTFIFQGKSGKKQIALTFDDAPDTHYTPKVLEILRKNGVKATFFIVGQRAATYPDMVKRIIREGHVIGNHSYDHAQLKKLSQERFIRQIQQTEDVLTPLAGYTPRLVRPPYGAVNDAELAWLKEQGYLTVNWNVDPQDWKGVSGSEVLKCSMDGAAPGAIILMHSAIGQGGSLQGTIDALPGLIEGLQGKGYQLVTLPELLQTKKSK